MRLSENEVQKDEIEQGIAASIPGATVQYDAWDGFLREFVTNGEALDLRNKSLSLISPKLWMQYPKLISLDLSENPHIKELPEELFSNLCLLK